MLLVWISIKKKKNGQAQPVLLCNVNVNVVFVIKEQSYLSLFVFFRVGVMFTEIFNRAMTFLYCKVTNV